MTPSQRYQADLEAKIIVSDSQQLAAVECLDDLYEELVRSWSRQQAGLTGKIRTWVSREPLKVPQGIYFWGGVGRGKTYLMDVLYDCLPAGDKLRTHFHRFMQSVHADLTGLKGEKNPLQIIGGRLADRARVICFDEFYVSDIGDAMILAGLLEALFERQVILIATSNTEPDRLYNNGLQRQRFLPAIDAIKAHMQVVRLDGGTDYRLRSLSRAELFHAPLDELAEPMLLENFEQLAPDLAAAERDGLIEILGRPILCRFCSDDVIWFDFKALCDGPRSAFDYVEIAKQFHAVLLGNVPQLDSDSEDEARRFVNLVDLLYDRSVKLIMTAAVPLDRLYVGAGLADVFERTRSRLLEMQSQEYLARPHRP